jgi:hypothetical protein
VVAVGAVAAACAAIAVAADATGCAAVAARSAVAEEDPTAATISAGLPGDAVPQNNGGTWLLGA